MYLRKNEEVLPTTDSSINFEMVVDDLLMVNIYNDVSDAKAICSYWRLLGTGEGIPPLEVGIDPERKIVREITFFVDKSCFKKIALQDDNIIQGNFSVNTDIFCKTYDFVDVEGQYFVSFTNGKFMCVFNNDHNVKEAFKNGHFEFFVNAQAELIGFAICSLDERQLRLISSLDSL